MSNNAIDSLRSTPRLISVIIPTWNNALTLSQQLEALSNQAYQGPWEVVIADNGSTDGTLEVAEAWRSRLPELRLISAHGRRGASFARNAGSAAAQGDFLVFCDGDDVVTSEWLEAMASAAEVGDLAGGALSHEALNDAITRAWHSSTPGDRLPIALDFLPFSPSCNLGIWTHAFNAIGGWAETFPAASGEDVELCWRAQLAGYGLVFAPRAIVNYRYRAGLRALARQRWVYGIAHVILYRRFRDRGLPRPALQKAVRAWAAIIKHIPDVAGSPEHKGIWIRMVSYRLGRLAGSLRYRTLCL